jgi:hypothetical protein
MTDAPRWLKEFQSIERQHNHAVEHAKDNVIAAARAWAGSSTAQADEALVLAVARLEHAEAGV